MTHQPQLTSESAASSTAAPGDVFRAVFTPEAWVRDYAIEVDAEGPAEWDCTRLVTERSDYFARLLESRRSGDWDDEVSGLLDNDDVLKEDPGAPEWVRDWAGPFTIRVFREPGEFGRA